MSNHLPKIICIISLLASGATLAVDNTSVETLDKASKNYRIVLDTNFSSNMIEGSESTTTNTTSIVPSYRHKSGFAFTTLLAVDKDLKGYKEQNIRDSYISVSKTIAKPTQYLSISGNVVGYIPLSKNSVKNDELRTGLKLGTTASVDLSSFGLKGARVSFLPSFRTNFHKFELDNDGESNSQYLLTGRLVGSYQINEKLGVSLDNIYYKQWSYNGTTKDIYIFDQALDITINSKVYAAIGHSIGANALAADGKSQNIELFDRDKSSFYINLGYIY